VPSLLPLRRFQTIIGLEIHAQLNVPTKLFSPALSSSSSSCSTRRPNDVENRLLLHPLDAAIPGFLPVLSQEAVHAALTAAHVLNCSTIPSTSRFERKHYPYADLPLGYQITQQRWPLARHGFVKVVVPPHATVVVDQKKKGKKKKITSSSSGDTGSESENAVKCRINRIQLEQDTGKTTTTTTTTTTTCPQNTDSRQIRRVVVSVESSRVDLNRAGCALLEIVTEPDLRTPNDAAILVETIRQLLAHVHVCQGRMERGQLRVDLNVNIEEVIDDNNDDDDDNDDSTLNQKVPYKRKQQQQKRRLLRRSPRVEVKNLNSIRQVQQAAEYEVLRQAHEWQDDDDEDENDTATTTCNDFSTKNDHHNLISLPQRQKPQQQQQQETRTWNATTKQTVLIRTKDQAHDYRFLPEPDLPPLVLYPPRPPLTAKRTTKIGSNDDTTNGVDNNNSYDDTDTDDDSSADYYLFPSESAMHDHITATMPELPTRAVQRLVSQPYGLSDYQARVIASDPPAIAYFDRAYASATLHHHNTARYQQPQPHQKRNEKSKSITNTDATIRHDKTAIAKASATAVASMVANFLCNDLFGLLKDHHYHHHHQSAAAADENESFDSDSGLSLSIQDSPVTAEQLGELVALVLNGTISKTMAKNLLAILYNRSSSSTNSSPTTSTTDDENDNNISSLSVAQLAVKYGFQLVSDPVQLREHVQNVLTNNDRVAAHDLERYFTMDDKVRGKLLKFFTGQCMAASHGNAEPEALREALEHVLMEMQQERKNNNTLN
jgi:aspartyl-tRNA(Asn)/glutamyl-tRNA(Gln) amidotransferase subunit B